MKIKLAMQAITKYILGVIFTALLLFLPAGTWRYPNGWLLLAVLFLPMFFLGLMLLFGAPELLKKRLKSKESEGQQRKMVGWSLVMFLTGFLLSALDFRLCISKMPAMVSVAAAIILLAAYALYGEVMRENTYLSRTVEIQKDQKVIDTGLYGLIRHPMYFATVLLFLSIPLVLGSWIGFTVFLVYPFLLAKRIENEEKVLEEGLEGYRQYKEKVRYRMIPFLW